MKNKYTETIEPYYCLLTVLYIIVIVDAIQTSDTMNSIAQKNNDTQKFVPGNKLHPACIGIAKSAPTIPTSALASLVLFSKISPRTPPTITEVHPPNT